MVYFIQSGLTGPIKIGFTGSDRSPANRLRTMQVGNPELLQLLAVIPDGGRQTEKWLHRAFAYAHIRDEWYQPDTLLLRVVERVQNGDDLTALVKHIERERPETPRPRRGRREHKRRVQSRIQREIAAGTLKVKRFDNDGEVQ